MAPWFQSDWPLSEFRQCSTYTPLSFFYCSLSFQGSRRLRLQRFAWDCLLRMTFHYQSLLDFVVSTAGQSWEVLLPATLTTKKQGAGKAATHGGPDTVSIAQSPQPLGQEQTFGRFPKVTFLLCFFRFHTLVLPIPYLLLPGTIP